MTKKQEEEIDELRDMFCKTLSDKITLMEAWLAACALISKMRETDIMLERAEYEHYIKTQKKACEVCGMRLKTT